MRRVYIALAILGALAALRAEPSNLQLFLLIGQSNMAGRGPLRPVDKIPHPGIFMLTKDLAWVPAVDPLHYDKPALVGVGLASNFARVVAVAEPGVRVGLIPAAYGGTSLDEWQAGKPLFAEAVRRAKFAAQRGHLAGILWHQGEADSAPALAATYALRFAAMIRELRKELGAENAPVIVGETGRFRPDAAPINQVLAQLPKEIPRCAFVSSEGLADKGDKLHFDSASLDEFGRRYAKAWMQLSAANDNEASASGKLPAGPPSGIK